MASNQPNLLQEQSADVDQVFTSAAEQDSRDKRLESLETRFGAVLTALQQEYPGCASMKRLRLLKAIERYDGDVKHIRKILQKHQEKHQNNQENSNMPRHQQQEEFKQKYANELAELEIAGINIQSPLVLQQLEKNRGNVQKVLEVMKQREEKKTQINQLDSKYSSQITQLENDGITIKNKRTLIKLLEQANGQVDVVKQLLAEKKEQKHQNKSPMDTSKIHDEQHEMTEDDLDHLKQLRSAGVYGNPIKILTIFHQCNGSIEMTIARLAKEREEREQQGEKRTQQRILLADVHDSYLSLHDRNDWPDHIEQVYLDGNNMMFVIDSLRRLCLNRARNKTERAIAEIASAWNEQMRIQNVELVFDSTRHLEQIDHIKISSAQPAYKTTDDMLIEIAQRADNKRKNQHTIIVTSDRALAAQLKREGCILVKPYEWFAHCAMVLTPDLIKHEEAAQRATTKHKIQCDLDELVRRVVKTDI